MLAAVVVPGAVHRERWFAAASIGDDTLLAVSETGCSNGVLVLGGSSILAIGKKFGKARGDKGFAGLLRPFYIHPHR